MLLVGFIIRKERYLLSIRHCIVQPVMLWALFSKPRVMQHLRSPKIIIIYQDGEDFDMQVNFVSWFVWLWNQDSYSQWRTWTVDVNVGVPGSNDNNRDDGYLLGRWAWLPAISWRQQFSLKPCSSSVTQHGVSSQKTAVFNSDTCWKETCLGKFMNVVTVKFSFVDLSNKMQLYTVYFCL